MNKKSCSRKGKSNLSQKELAYIAKKYSTMSSTEIAKRLNRSRHAVIKAAQRLSLPRNLSAKLTHMYPDGRTKIKKKRNGCWEWTASKTKFGHGIAHGKDTLLAHRQIYIDAKGPIPTGLVLDHLCSNPACVNPDHLEPVRQKLNVWRGKMAKLSLEQVREIRADQTSTRLAIAKKYRICISNVGAILNGETWREEMILPT